MIWLYAFMKDTKYAENLNKNQIYIYFEIFY
jgi:hypothetical protein